MNAAGLMALWDRISDAPDAVRRLRQFVLDLAVRGKLVEQDACDEPASILLARITEQTKQTASGAVPRGRSKRALRSSEPDFSIPSGWAWARVGDVSSLVTSGSRDWAQYYAEDGAAFLRMSNLSKGNYHLRLNEVQRVRAPASSEGVRTRLEAGDILISITGDVGLLGLVPDNFGEAYINQHTALVRLVPEIKGRYLPEVFRSAFAQEQFGGPQRGIKNSFRLTDVTEVDVPLPPVAEQHRIVAKIDELMALCDRLEAARAERESRRDRLVTATITQLSAVVQKEKGAPIRPETPSALSNMSQLTARSGDIINVRAAICDLAVQGLLVPQAQHDEPAVEQLSRLRTAQAEAIANDGLRSRPPIQKVERDDLKFGIPSAWELPAFDDIFVIVSGVTKGQPVAAGQGIELPYLRVANVQRGSLDLTLVKTLTVSASDAARYRLLPGDLLMTEGGDWDKLGRTAIWRGEIGRCIHQNHIFRVRPPSTDISAEWVSLYVNSRFGRRFFENASKQTTNLASINMTQLRACPLPLPPLAEQHRIVAKVTKLQILCDRLEASLVVGAEARRALLEATLRDALAPALDQAA